MHISAHITLCIALLLCIACHLANAKDIYRWKVIPTIVPYIDTEYVEFQYVLERFREYFRDVARDEHGEPLPYYLLGQWHYDGKPHDHPDPTSRLDQHYYFYSDWYDIVGDDPQGYYQPYIDQTRLMDRYKLIGEVTVEVFTVPDECIGHPRDERAVLCRQGNKHFPELTECPYCAIFSICMEDTDCGPDNDIVSCRYRVEFGETHKICLYIPERMYQIFTFTELTIEFSQPVNYTHVDFQYRNRTVDPVQKALDFIFDVPYNEVLKLPPPILHFHAPLATPDGTNMTVYRAIYDHHVSLENFDRYYMTRFRANTRDPIASRYTSPDHISTRPITIPRRCLGLNWDYLDVRGIPYNAIVCGHCGVDCYVGERCMSDYQCNRYGDRGLVCESNPNYQNGEVRACLPKNWSFNTAVVHTPALLTTGAALLVVMMVMPWMMTFMV